MEINKRDIRRRMKTLRTMLSDMEKECAADSVFEQLEKTAAFMMADKVLMYHSLPDELQTVKFLKKWSGRKHFFLPRVNGVNLDILPYEEQRLELGAFHIEEPTGDTVSNPEEIELVIVPAVAYDRKGTRLGRGKGYYDRLLSTLKATTIGVGYDFQLYDELPSESHDVPVHMVITPSHCIVIR